MWCTSFTLNGLHYDCHHRSSLLFAECLHQVLHLSYKYTNRTTYSHLQYVSIGMHSLRSYIIMLPLLPTCATHPCYPLPTCSRHPSLPAPHLLEASLLPLHSLLPACSRRPCYPFTPCSPPARSIPVTPSLPAPHLLEASLLPLHSLLPTCLRHPC